MSATARPLPHGRVTHQTSVGTGNDSEALTLLEYRTGGSATGWAAGKDRSVLAATLAAVTRAANVG